MEGRNSLKEHSEVNQCNWKSELPGPGDISQVFQLDTYGLLGPWTPLLWAGFDRASHRKMNDSTWSAVCRAENCSLCTLGCLCSLSRDFFQSPHITVPFMHVNLSSSNSIHCSFPLLLGQLKTKEANELSSHRIWAYRWQTPRDQIDAATLWVNLEQENIPASQGFDLDIYFFQVRSWFQVCIFKSTYIRYIF